jgi:hypothetical protein
MSTTGRIGCRSIGTVVLIVLLAVIVTPTLLIYSCNHPTDRVQVEVDRVPKEVFFLCIVGETPNGPVAFDWYVQHIFQPFTIKAHNSPYFDFDSGKPRLSASVQWKPADRYGVLMGKRGGEWRVYWFTPDQVNLRGHAWSSNGRLAEFRLADAMEVATPSLELMNAVDLSKDWKGE